MLSLRVVEIFHSLQGEGFLVGIPSVFVRLAGCAFRCAWCDTAYAWPAGSGTSYTVDEIQRAVERYPASHLVITGGEPLADVNMCPRPGLPALTRSLRKPGKHITIETAGPVFVQDLACDLMSISPKLQVYRSYDHQARQAYVCHLQALTHRYHYQLKFVLEHPRDIETVQSLLQSLGTVDPGRVMLMPQSRTRQELMEGLAWTAELCLQHGYALGQRLHLLLWDGQRGR